MKSFLVLGAASQTVQAGEKCYALAMSGGGTKGAWEAGGLYGMYHALTDKTQVQYDVLTGVSTGSINSFGMLFFEKGTEEKLV